MAAHQMAIAKASFAASLLRPDPVALSRTDSSRLHAQLDETIAVCSSPNVQKCKVWLLEHVAPSQRRTTAFAKYLVALSASFQDDSKDRKQASKPSPSLRRQRLHLIYVLHDLLHHCKHHTADVAFASLAGTVQPFLTSLIGSAASFDHKRKAKDHERLLSLLNIWERSSYFGQESVDKLRVVVAVAGKAFVEGLDLALEEAGVGEDFSHAQRDFPYMMPATHGDTYLPWYDLPAGNFLPHIVPNSTQPINPQMVKPLHFSAGPADDSLTLVVKDFLKEVETMYVKRDYLEDEGIVADIDEMGQVLHRDEVTGELAPNESYYGWSIDFCRRMKARRAGVYEPMGHKNGTSRGRSRDGSRDSSRSPGPRKRRRHSSSDRSARSRSRTRSPPRASHRGEQTSTRRQRSYSRSRSRSRDQASRRDRNGHDPRSRGASRSRARSRSASATRSAARTNQETARAPAAAPALPPHAWQFLSKGNSQSFHTPSDQITDPFNAQTVVPPPPSAPNASQFQHNFQLGPGGLPIPPPPPYHRGPWPPPPPVGSPFGAYPTPYQQSQSPQQHQFMPPPPPPPSASFSNQSPFPGQLQPAWQGGPQGHQGYPPAPPSSGPGWQPPRGPGQGQWQGGSNNWRGRGGRGR